MNDYQPHKNNPYYIEQTLYMQALNFIRSYRIYIIQADDILLGSNTLGHGMPKSNSISKTVEQIAEKRERYLEKIRIIEDSLTIVPEEYRRGVWENIMRHKPYPRDAADRTYRRWKARYIYEVAKRAKII